MNSIDIDEPMPLTSRHIPILQNDEDEPMPPNNENTQQKRLEYLLKQTEVYAHFITNATKPFNKKTGTVETNRPAKHSRRLLQSANEIEDSNTTTSNNNITSFTETPFYIQNGTMRDYQIRGLNWMIALNENGINGILADEMGLGKTLQTISMIGYLKHIKNQNGPHLIIVPLTTIDNWVNEFKKWCPSVRAIALRDRKDKRKPFINNVVRKTKWDVLITSYDICMLENSLLKCCDWNYLIIDEAQRIKNCKAKLSRFLRNYNSKNRLLLTGTPLQNNLNELFSLLHFLLPDIFNSLTDFNSWFDVNSLIDDTSIVQRLHNVLKPFLLRRLKSEVEKTLLPKKELNIYVGLTEMQIQLYKDILMKNIPVLNNYDMMANKKLSHILMHLRKCTNHPYLFPGYELGPPYTTDKHIVDNSGKMIVLDKLLPKLQQQGSRVLIFSQMTRMMDIIEDYLTWKKYNYCRLDGTTKIEERVVQVNEYNEKNSEKFIFLISTRAGGLGINLATADTVIIYDSDWNPQVDLQAMDRSHRIGQTKQVHVFRFITENTIDEKMNERAATKIKLDKIVIQHGHLAETNEINKYDMLKMIQHGATKLFANTNNTHDNILDKNIDEILKIAEIKTTEQINAIEQMEENVLEKFSLDFNPINLYNFDGENYKLKNNYANNSDDDIFQTIHNEILNTKLPPRKCRQKKKTEQILFETKENKKKRIFYRELAKKKFVWCNYWFYPHKLKTLINKERDLQREMITKIEFMDIQEDFKLVTLSDEEIAEKNKLVNQGFTNWKFNEYHSFIANCEKYGIDDIDSIEKAIQSKTREEIIAYRKVFLERYKELVLHQRRIKNIVEKSKDFYIEIF